MSDDHQVGPPDAASRPEPTPRTRLPPPAFPPGSRRIDVRRSLKLERSGDSSTLPDDVPFISPDEPIPHREPRTEGMAQEAANEMEEEQAAFDPFDGVVTGIGGDAHLDVGELPSGGDADVSGLLRQLETLTEALGHRGEAALHITPEMSRFEVTLRAYCVGYLAGRRTEDERKE